MADSIFTKIINGEIPAYKIYEDEKTIAFLDIHPIQPGMVLVVSKTPAETFLDLNDEDALALWQTVRKVAAHMRQVFPDKKRIGVQIEGLDVPHVHIKLLPINTGDEFRAKADMSADPDDTALAEMVQKLAF